MLLNWDSAVGNHVLCEQCGVVKVLEQARASVVSVRGEREASEGKCLNDWGLGHGSRASSFTLCGGIALRHSCSHGLEKSDPELCWV